MTDNTWFERNRFPLLLVFVVVCMVMVIESCRPFFFLHDDNLQQNLPYYIHNVRSILSGEFPLYNFHQYLGTPVFSCIQSAALYLPNYVALFLSKLLLGHYFGTMEFIAGFHLLLAALGFYRLMRYCGLNEWSSSFGAIAWTFCGFVIPVGHRWIQVVGYAGYLPWILFFSLQQMGRFELRSFCILVLIRVLNLCLGYPPYFIYTVTFDLLTVSILYIIVSGSSDEKGEGRATLPPVQCGAMTFLVKQGISFFCVFLLAAPLLLPAMHQVGISADRKAPLSWEQYAVGSYPVSYWLHGLLVPLSTVGSHSWAPQPLQLVSHIGWLTLVFCVAAFWQKGLKRKLVMAFLGLAIFSFLWANDTIVTQLFYHLPFYNRQRWPFKLAFFTSFFLIVVAAFGFDGWYRRSKGFSGRRMAVLVIIFLVHIGNFLSIYLATPNGIFARQEKSPPYEEPLVNMLGHGRIVTVVYENSLDKANHSKIIPLLGYDYATLFGLYHFAGYELLASEKNLKVSLDLNYSSYFYVDRDVPFNPSITDLEYFRKWGVKWYVLEKSVRFNASGALKPVYSDDNRVVLRDDSARPFVFWTDSLADNIKYTFTSNSISAITERATKGQLLVNVLYNPFFIATIDGRQSVLTETSDNQTVITVPPGRHLVKISYRDSYFMAGVYISIGFMLLMLVGWLSFRYKRR